MLDGGGGGAGRSSLFGVSAQEVEMDDAGSHSTTNNTNISSGHDSLKRTGKGSRVSELAKALTSRMSLAQSPPNQGRPSSWQRQSNASKPRASSLWESDSEAGSDSVSVNNSDSSINIYDAGGASAGGVAASDGQYKDRVARQSLTAERKSMRISLAAIFSRQLFNRKEIVSGENPQFLTPGATKSSSTTILSGVQRQPSTATTSFARTPSILGRLSSSHAQSNSQSPADTAINTNTNTSTNPIHSEAFARTPSLVPGINAVHPKQSTTKVRPYYI